MPAPSKFTEARKEQIIAVLKVGGSRETAAQVSGVAYETLRIWLKRGEEMAQKAEEADEESGSAYAEFRERVLAAEAEPRFKALAIVDKAMVDNPMLAWKVIERREPGYAPPMPGSVGGGAPQVHINLSLTGSAAPLPAWLEGEVIEGEVVEDAEEVPAIGDGSDSGPAETSGS